MRRTNRGPRKFNGRRQMQNRSFSELASNMFHALVAGLFGIVTLAAVAHVALSLA